MTSDRAMMQQPLVIVSGASEAVIPLDWFTDHEPDTNAEKCGKPYTSASNHTIHNMGERTLTLYTVDYPGRRTMKFQVTDVNKALGSASKIVRSGNKIVFDLDEHGNDYSYIGNKKSRDRLWLRDKNGVYVLDMLVAPPGYNTDSSTQYCDSEQSREPRGVQ